MPIYQPSDDSFLLASSIKKISKNLLKKNPDATFLDLGTGSCIQAEAALESGFKKENILTADINSKAVKNALKKGFKSLKSDLFEDIKGRFDLIAFNPPYLPYSKYDNNIDTCGGKKGYETAVKFIKNLKQHLNKKGAALLLISSLTQPETVKKEIKKQHLECIKIALKHLFFEELLVFSVQRKALLFYA